MLQEFKLALLRGVEPAVVAKDLEHEAAQEMDRRKREIEQSRKAADFIALGLKEPEGSEPRTIADGYLRQYEQDTGENVSEYLNDNTIAERLRKEVLTDDRAK